MNIEVREPEINWGAASPDSFFDQPSCVVFVDMVSSTALWEMIWRVEKMIGTLPVVSDRVSIKRECWDFVRGTQNAILEAFLNRPRHRCNLVKGLGDGFIFQTGKVLPAYYSCIAAEQAVGVFVEDPKRLKTLEKLRDQLARGRLASAKVKALYNLTKSLLDALRAISFRFLVHWTGNIVHGLFDIKKGKNKWSDGTAGLRLAEQHADPKKWLICKPFYPDLFGHDMNYAARCLGAAKDPGIYLTQGALKKVKGEIKGGKPKKWPESQLDYVVQISVKGITTEHVAFYKALKNRAGRNKRATVSIYKAKAIVVRDASHEETANDIFKAIEKLITGEDEDKTKEYQRLRPHVFSVALIRPRDPKRPFQVLFRVEGSDQEYIENIVAGERGINTLLAERPAGADHDDAIISVDTETRFIRTNITHRSPSRELELWAERGQTQHLPWRYFYVEVGVKIFEDIDTVAANIIDAALRPDPDTPKLGIFELVELCRLWGKPAMYAILRADATPWGDDIKATREAILKASGASSRNITVTVHKCERFATLVLPAETISPDGEAAPVVEIETTSSDTNPEPLLDIETTPPDGNVPPLDGSLPDDLVTP